MSNASQAAVFPIVIVVNGRGDHANLIRSNRSWLLVLDRTTSDTVALAAGLEDYAAAVAEAQAIARDHGYAAKGLSQVDVGTG